LFGQPLNLAGVQAGDSGALTGFLPFFWLGPKEAKTQGQPKWLRLFTNGSLVFFFVFVNLLRRFVPPALP